MNINNVKITDVSFSFTTKGKYYYVAGSRLTNCVFELASQGDNYSFAASTFDRCRFVAKRTVLDLRLTDVKLVHCTFEGRFENAMFGFLPGPDGSSDCGSVSDCNFSRSVLSYCAFLGCDLKTLLLPGWPCFAVLDQRAALKAATKDKRLSKLSPLFSSDPYSTEVCTFHHAPTICRDFDLDADLLEGFVKDAKFTFVVGHTA